MTSASPWLFALVSYVPARSVSGFGIGFPLRFRGSFRVETAEDYELLGQVSAMQAVLDM